MKSSDPTRILAFSHVPKTGGITLRHLLRRHFGLRHLDVQYRTPGTPTYSARDMRLDFKICPGLRSIAGHSLKPFVDFSSIRKDFFWFTMLRDPYRRFLSHYQHEVEKNGKTMGLQQWAETFHRHDWQVRMLAGEEDVEASKQILAERFGAVLLQEEYDLSLRVLRHRMALPQFDIQYDRPRNTSNPILKEKLLAEMDKHRELIEANNSLDRELYDYAKSEIWQKQCVELPEQDPIISKRPLASTRLVANYLRRNLFYKPLCVLDRVRQR